MTTPRTSAQAADDAIWHAARATTKPRGLRMSRTFLLRVAVADARRRMRAVPAVTVHHDRHKAA